MGQRPRSRKKNVTGGGSGVNRRTGTSGGPLGGSGSFLGSRRGSSGSSSGSSSGGSYHSIGGGTSGGSGRGGRILRGGSRSGCVTIIILIAVVLIFGRKFFSGGGSGGLLGNLLGGGSSTASYTSGGGTLFGTGSTGGQGGSTAMSYEDLLSSLSNGSSQGWVTEENTGTLNTSVSSAARERYTTIKGGGKDTVTIMVYMCGSDLESQSGMATSDLYEMQSATISDNVNVVVFTGGASRWQNSIVSNKVNQIYEIHTGGVKCVNKDAGNASMTDPSTLSSFITWASKKYPANRMCLIMWDHGGGSITGYGHDEKQLLGGTMTLSGINKALKSAGIKYDFIGFDACLMATTETALMLGNYADYLIASEETEPGIGWSYTNWLTKLSANTSISTLDLGKIILDDYTAECARKCPGMETTLSLTDLAELSQTLPDKLAAFAKSANTLIENGNYQTVATARSTSREFARSTMIDQIDLVNFAEILATKEGQELADTIKAAVKYNRTSSRSANAYGLSIYFPYKKVSKLDSILSTYNDIDMDDDYADCIRHFAQVQASGAATSGSSGSPYASLFGGNSFNPGSYTSTGGSSGSSSGSSYGTSISGDAMTQLLTSLLGGGGLDFSSLNLGGLGLDRSNTQFLNENPLPVETVEQYVSSNRLNEEDITWQANKDKQPCLVLDDAKWAQIQAVDMALYYDDGKGYVEMGLDNTYDFDDDGSLLPTMDGTWISINGQPVAYYHTETMDDGEQYRISGEVPVLLNGESANLILVFDDENEYGYVAGARYDYEDEEEDCAEGKIFDLQEGDTLEFVASCYTYDGDFEQNYLIGDPITVTDQADLTISDTSLGSGDCVIIYRFTDMYGTDYWTSALHTKK